MKVFCLCTAVRNNGGGHLNHTMFWEIMSPQGGGDSTGAIAQEINKTFGSFQQFKDQFNQAGSGIIKYVGYCC